MVGRRSDVFRRGYESEQTTVSTCLLQALISTEVVSDCRVVSLPVNTQLARYSPLSSNYTS